MRRKRRTLWTSSTATESATIPPPWQPAAQRRQAKPAPVQPKAPTTRAELISAIERAWPQACPHDNLQDALMSRFGCNSLIFLSVDMLEAVLAAITK